MKKCVQCGMTWHNNTWQCIDCNHEPQIVNSIVQFASPIDSNYGFSDEFFPKLASLEDGHFWFESRNILILHVLRRFLPLNASFFEIGCGSGFVLGAVRRTFPTLAISASEVSVVGLSVAKSRVSNVSFYQMDARNIPFREEFDAIGVFDVLEHIDDDSLAIRESFQSLKKGGILVLTVPQHQWLWSRTDEISHHHRRYSRKDLENKLILAGFDIIYKNSFVLLLLPIVIIIRKIKYSLFSNENAKEEVRIGCVYNKICKLVMALELALILFGLRLPVGSSLVMVGRRPGGVDPPNWA